MIYVATECETDKKKKNRELIKVLLRRGQSKYCTNVSVTSAQQTRQPRKNYEKSTAQQNKTNFKRKSDMRQNANGTKRTRTC